MGIHLGRTKTTARRLIVMSAGKEWPVRSCRRYFPWYYEVELRSGRYPMRPVPIANERGTTALVRANLRPRA